MSSKNKSKRKNKCSGWGTPKDQHDFAAMGKYCEGPEERNPDSDGNMDEKSPVGEEKTLAPDPGNKQNALLQAIRTLSSQVEALQLKQQTLHDTVTELKTTKDKIGVVPQHTNHPLAPTTTTITPPFRRNSNLHLAHTVALANQFQVPYLKP